MKWTHFLRHWHFVQGIHREFPAQRPVTRGFDVFYDLRLNKWLLKQSWSWWFETPSRPLWRHWNAWLYLSFTQDIKRPLLFCLLFCHSWLYLSFTRDIKRSLLFCLLFYHSRLYLSLTQDINILSLHDDVIKWKHFPRYWPFVQGIHRWPVNSPHKGQWRGALMFSLICAWINGCVNNREAGDLRRHRTHYDVTVMHDYIYPLHRT